MKTLPTLARAGRGFTLVELLTAIAIIALLASLLMVGVKGWQERGRRAACLSNLRQIHGLIISYVNDHDDEFPKSVPPNAPLRLTAQYNSLIQANLTRNEKVFQCAGRVASGPAASNNDWHYEYNAKLSSPGGGSSSSDSGGGSSSGPLKLSMVRNAATTRMAWDSDDEDRDGFYDDTDNHGKAGGNVLYVDGHVQWINGSKYDAKDETDVSK
ncbi:MAG: type II secretion system GspH family protein [Verrucomicrobiae bacterium]|nr:type II secretion system GspH family protein [Verrucomicrobiae bacterium]